MLLFHIVTQPAILSHFSMLIIMLTLNCHMGLNSNYCPKQWSFKFRLPRMQFTHDGAQRLIVSFYIQSDTILFNCIFD